jgi:hypothetical protein
MMHLMMMQLMQINPFIKHDYGYLFSRWDFVDFFFILQLVLLINATHNKPQLMVVLRPKRSPKNEEVAKVLF